MVLQESKSLKCAWRSPAMEATKSKPQINSLETDMTGMLLIHCNHRWRQLCILKLCFAFKLWQNVHSHNCYVVPTVKTVLLSTRSCEIHDKKIVLIRTSYRATLSVSRGRGGVHECASDCPMLYQWKGKRQKKGEEDSSYAHKSK